MYGQKGNWDQDACKTCKSHSGRQCHRVSGACFLCSQMGHMARDCPKAGGGNNNNGGYGGDRQQNNRGYGNDRQQASQGRVHSLTRHQAASTSGTVSGTLHLFGRTTFTLFDTGATHSVISNSFAKHINIPATPLKQTLSISTPMKNCVIIDREYLNCPIRFDDKIRSANLLPLDMNDFDIILGMDWLSEHRATIDCHTIRVIFGNLYAPEFVYQGSKPGISVKIISALKARSLLSHGCEGFLASIKDT